MRVPFIQQNKVSIFAVSTLILVGGTAYIVNNFIRSTTEYVESRCDPVQIPEEVLLLFSKNLFDDQMYLRPCKSPHYQKTGKVRSGQYAGWDRVAVSIPADRYGPGYDPVFFLATKDGSHFVLDESNFKKLDQEYISQFDEEVVTITTSLPNVFTPEIDMGSYKLLQIEAEWGSVPTDAIELQSLIPGVKFYARPPKQQDLPDARRAVRKEFNTLQSMYAEVTTEVLVEDYSGFRYWYHLVLKDMKDSPVFSKQHTNNDIDFTESNSYDEYHELWRPYGCGSYGVSTILRGISDDDLAPFTKTVSGVQLHTFREGHGTDILKATYDHKILGMPEALKEYQTKNSPLPTYEEYVAKHPVLIAKDPWGRWYAFGETDFYTSDGCGKPVVYLYPQIQTEVRVKFPQPIKLTRMIPDYHDGWNVMADTDGILIDLQPQYTMCSLIDASEAGSEYASDACRQNSYPYLYWAGQASGQYPEKNTGWIVARANLDTFLVEKLAAVGLNSRESTDMRSYWVSRLDDVSAPYYRITFFDTNDMNAFVPMAISPRPDTVIRVFLDWAPLSRYPDVIPEPQVLTTPERKGFVVVEWGGLQR